MILLAVKRTNLWLTVCFTLVSCTKVPQSQPPVAKIEFVIDGESRLVYDCNKFQSQIKDTKDIIQVRHKVVETLPELQKDHNLALQTSLGAALRSNDNLRVEELLIKYQCGKLVNTKR